MPGNISILYAALQTKCTGCLLWWLWQSGVVNLTITHVINTHVIWSVASESAITIFEQWRENTFSLSQRTWIGSPCSDLWVPRMQLLSQNFGMLFKHMSQPHFPYKNSPVKPCFLIFLNFIFPFTNPFSLHAESIQKLMLNRTQVFEFLFHDLEWLLSCRECWRWYELLFQTDLSISHSEFPGTASSSVAVAAL